MGRLDEELRLLDVPARPVGVDPVRRRVGGRAGGLSIPRELTGGAGIDTFADFEGVDTLVEARNVDFTLSNTQFVVTGNGEVDQLVGIFESARLYGY